MIKFNKEQRAFLQSELSIAYIPSKKEEIQEVLSKLDNLLLIKGFGGNWKPNEYGLKIEALIDIFSREIYK